MKKHFLVVSLFLVGLTTCGENRNSNEGSIVTSTQLSHLVTLPSVIHCTQKNEFSTVEYRLSRVENSGGVYSLRIWDSEEQKSLGEETSLLELRELLVSAQSTEEEIQFNAHFQTSEQFSETNGKLKVRDYEAEQIVLNNDGSVSSLKAHYLETATVQEFLEWGLLLDQKHELSEEHLGLLHFIPKKTLFTWAPLTKTLSFDPSAFPTLERLPFAERVTGCRVEN